MSVFITNEQATPATQAGTTWTTTVSFTTGATPAGGMATPRYSTASPDMSLVSGAGSPVLVAAAGTPMFDVLKLTLNAGRAKPALVQIDIDVTVGAAGVRGGAVVPIT